MASSQRRSSGRTTGPASRGGQSTLSFGNRGKITKNVTSETKGKKQKDLDGANTASTVRIADVKPEVQTAHESEVEPEAEVAVVPQSTEEKAAGKIKDAQIKKYWKAIEGERRAPRVHQGHLDMDEKILRHFDLSSQYGPCIGIGREKRWKRANRLKLHPPMEVLAVLLREQNSKRTASDRAFMDELMS